MCNQPYAKYFGANVRRISRGLELVVQKRNPLTEGWDDVITFHQMSNDYAYTESAEYASRLAASR